MSKGSKRFFGVDRYKPSNRPENQPGTAVVAVWMFCRRCVVKAINKAMEKLLEKTLLCGFILLSGLWAGQRDSWAAVGGAVMECYQCEGERARCENNFATLRPCPPNTTSCRSASRHTAASPFLLLAWCSNDVMAIWSL